MAPQPPPSSSLTFIRPTVLQRLAEGDFVARRQSSRRTGREDDKEKDRRSLTSPLAVLKQCLPLNPSVFTDRTQELLDLGNLLNQPQTRLLALGGESGMGKSTLIRGLTELMGGGPEQVLWVDATYVRTDSGMATFLVEALQFLSSKVTDSPEDEKKHPPEEVKPDTDPMVQLQHQLKRLQKHPIAVIIDHVEHLLNDRRQFESPISHELIGFLQTLPNVCIILAGHTLPANLNQYTGTVVHTLGPLRATGHNPLWQTLSSSLPGNIHSPTQAIATVWNQCNPTQAMLATVLTALRHPVTLPQLHQLLSGSQPKGTPSALQPLMDTRQCFAALKQAPYKPLLKRSLSPQRLLTAWQQAQQAANPTITADELMPESEWHYQWYDGAHSLLENTIPPQQLRRYHQKLAQYYMSQRTVPVGERLLPVANSALIHQARHHLELADTLNQQEDIAVSEDTLTDDYLDERLTEHARQQATVESPEEDEPRQADNKMAPAPSLSSPPLSTPTHITVIQSPQPPSGNAPVVSVPQALPPTKHNALVQTEVPYSDLTPEPVDSEITSWLARQLQLARQQQANGQWEDAATVLHNLLRHCQTTEAEAQWWQCMGHLQLAQGHLSQWQLTQANSHAQTAFNLAATLQQQSLQVSLPGPVASLFMQCGIALAETSNQQHQPNEALTAINHILSLSAPHEETTETWHNYLAQSHFQAALAHDALQHPDDAQQHYQKAIALLKQHEHWEPLSAASVNLGCLLLENQHTQQAIPVLEDALKVEETHLKRPAEWVDTLRLLAQAYAQQRNYAQALSLLEQALTLAKQHQRPDWIIGTLIDLGHSHHGQGDTQNAQAYYQHAHQYLTAHLQQHPSEAPLYGNWKAQLGQWLGLDNKTP